MSAAIPGNFGALELHPWTSTVDAPDRPTWALFDIDPGGDEPRVARHPGALVEDKAHGFVLHYRQAPEAGPEAAALLSSLVAEDPTGFDLLEVVKQVPRAAVTYDSKIFGGELGPGWLLRGRGRWSGAG